MACHKAEPDGERTWGTVASFRLICRRLIKQNESGCKCGCR
jgi:hypothetical protein